MKDIDIINASYGISEFEQLPLWENVNHALEEVDKISKKLLDSNIIINFSFNIGNNILKLHINPANLMINCNRLEYIIAGEEDTDGTSLRDIEKKKFKSKEEMKALADKGMFKNWTRISNINAEYWFLYHPKQKVQERKRRLFSEAIDSEELVQQNMDASKEWATNEVNEQVKKYVQAAFNNKYFQQYGVEFLDDSKITMGDKIEIEGGDSNALNKEDFICVELHYKSDKKITRNMMPLVAECAQDVVDNLTRHKIFDTDDINVYDIITHYSETSEDYNQPFTLYILIRIPNLINNLK